MLARIEGYAAALLGSLDRPSLERAVGGLRVLEQTTLARSDLRAVLGDTSLAGPVRGEVVRDLLAGKLDPVTVRLAVYAAAVAPAQEVTHNWSELSQVGHVLLDTGHLEQTPLAHTDARRRVSGYADALLDGVDIEQFSTIEDELFRWARTVEANVGLRRLLLDRDAPLEARSGATKQLLQGRVADSTLRLALFVIEGGRPRDVIGTLDFLVDYVARARHWRVARVHTARPLGAENRERLATSLHSLTGQNVELQVNEEPNLLGGILVEVGDLLLDATTRGRLGALHEDVASGRLFRTTLSND
jgi:F-type H+-transporting ATPase subunit delta